MIDLDGPVCAAKPGQPGGPPLGPGQQVPRPEVQGRHPGTLSSSNSSCCIPLCFLFRVAEKKSFFKEDLVIHQG